MKQEITNDLARSLQNIDTLFDAVFVTSERDPFKACKSCKLTRPDCGEYPSPEGSFCHGHVIIKQI